MRSSTWRTVALVGCLSLLIGNTSFAQRQREYQLASDAAKEAESALTSYGSFDAVDTAEYQHSEEDTDGIEPTQFVGGGFGVGGGVGIGGGVGFGGAGSSPGTNVFGRPGQLFAGAEYIYARASFSEAFAFVRRANATAADEFIEYDFDYNSSYRFYGGYQFSDCLGAITFDYARYRSEAGMTVTEGVGEELIPPYEVGNPGVNNDTIISNADVDLSSYGLGISRTIPLGGCLCGGCCDCGDTCCDDPCCGDACGGCWCPVWGITWMAGFRYADLGWSRSQENIYTGTAIGQNEASFTRLDFEGAGARIGLMGRRFIGRRGWASIYARGDISLLVGDVDISTTTDGDTTDTAAPVLSHQNSGRRVIPVTEIEAGGSAHVGNHITLSGGYFIAAWHDLGMRDTYDFGGALSSQLSHYDDANILGFDGFFARAEIAY